MVTMVEILLIILAIINDAHFHSTIYFFLANLTFIDIFHKLYNLQNIGRLSKSELNHLLCRTPFTNVLFYVAGGPEQFLLAAATYDWYIAIYHPLHCAALPSTKHCDLLVVTSWIFSNIVSILHFTLLNLLTFCDQRGNPHFFHDLGHILKLACPDTQINNLKILVTGGATPSPLFLSPMPLLVA